MIVIIIIAAVVRGEKTRKDFSRLLRQHRAAVIIQKQYKGRISRNIYKDVYDASVLLQSGTKFFSFIVASPLYVEGDFFSCSVLFVELLCTRQIVNIGLF